MVKITILGSLEKGESYEVRVPSIRDVELYRGDHEEAYRKATETFHPAIESSEFVLVYAPDGIGEHTGRDLEHAIKNKIPHLIYPDDMIKARAYDDIMSRERRLKLTDVRQEDQRREGRV